MNQSTSGKCVKRNSATRWQDHQENANHMNEYQGRIAAEFSTFWLSPPAEKSTAWFPQKVPDPQLKQTIARLIADDLGVEHDAWARYFWLMLSKTPSTQEETCETPASLTFLKQLEATIQAVIQQAQTHNSPVLPIHRHIQARYEEAGVTRFLEQADRHTKALLTAYLQPCCWYTANRFFTDKEECFRIAVLATSDPTKLLQSFELSRTVQIRTYAEGKLRGIVLDALKAGSIQRKTASLGDDGLLRSVSRKELLEALNTSDKFREKLATYELVFLTYKEIYKRQRTHKTTLKPPTSDELEQIAACFNQRRSDRDGIPATGRTIQAMLEEMARAIRRYRTDEAFHLRIIEHRSQLEDNNPLDRIVQQEAREQIQGAVQRSFLQLPAEIQHLLIATYGLGLTQNESLEVMGNLLQVKKQFQVSRKAKKYKQAFMKDIILELKAVYPELFDNRPDIDRLVDNVQEIVIAQFLQPISEQSFHAILATQLQRLQQEKCLSLTSFFYSDANQHLSKLGQQLNAFIEETMRIQFSQCATAEKKLIDYVTAWLSNR